MHKALPLLVLGLAAAAGCGSSSSSDPTTSAPSSATTKPPAAAPSALTIKMTEFAFAPKDATAKAGKVTITAPNNGKTTHELVVLRTSADPGKLPKKNGKVDESTSVGEIADVGAGQTKKHAFTLKPGTYAIVCALPGHYESGMYGSITVR